MKLFIMHLFQSVAQAKISSTACYQTMKLFLCNFIILLTLLDQNINIWISRFSNRR